MLTSTQDRFVELVDETLLLRQAMRALLRVIDTQEWRNSAGVRLCQDMPVVAMARAVAQ